MSVLVVDASIAAKWFFDEVHSAAAIRILGTHYRLHAPDFLLVEFDSLVWKCVRRKLITLSEARQVRRMLRRLPVQEHPCGPLLDLAFALAVRTGATVYDCQYVALAMAIKGRVVSADRRLCDAMAGGPFSKHIVWIEDLDP